MITISLCMIVKNEENVLARCLECIKDLVDEIIIVDTGSIDRTKEIASRFTDKIYDFKWIDDFAAARNYSFSKATMEYIFWLDADDVILEEDRLKFKWFKDNINLETDVVMMKYNLEILGNGESSITFYRERLLKRSMNFKWHDPVHEYLDFRGKILSTDVCISHKKEHRSGARNLKILEKMIAEGKELSPRNLFYYARELNFNGRYEEAIIYYNKFLKTDGEYIPNYLDSCLDLANCYLLRNEKRKALQALLKSFEYGIPRAEVCCKMGYYYKSLEDYNKAISWFDLASKLEKPEEGWGSVVNDCWDFVPYIELSICYFKLGNIAEAIRFNEIAAKSKPDHPVVLQNRAYFQEILKSLCKLSQPSAKSPDW